MSSTTRRLSGTLALVALCTPFPAAVHGVEMASDNYQIVWDVLDGGGGTMRSDTLASNQYVLHGSLGQPIATGVSTSGPGGFTLVPGFFAPPDTDGDSLRDFLDNCIEHRNPDQLDTDGDGYGNRCDGDLNGDNIVNVLDLGLFKRRFLTMTQPPEPPDDADLNGDGIVNVLDLGLFKRLFLKEPGPTGLRPLPDDDGL